MVPFFSLFQKNKNARRRQKKLKAYDLSTLTDFLPDLTEQQKQPAPAKSDVNCKSRQKLVWVTDLSSSFIYHFIRQYDFSHHFFIGILPGWQVEGVETINDRPQSSSFPVRSAGCHTSTFAEHAATSRKETREEVWWWRKKEEEKEEIKIFIWRSVDGNVIDRCMFPCFDMYWTEITVTEILYLGKIICFMF